VKEEQLNSKPLQVQYQYAQLLLKNPHNTLHHDKRQKFKPVTWP